MNNSKLDWQRALYALAFLIAAAIRLGGLGHTFLSDAEATWAVQAFHVAQSSHPDIGPQPGLVLLTGALFFVFGSSEFLARLAPAIAGSLLVFAPLFLRKPLGKTAATIAAFGLALDPGLVAMSRQVDGHMLALAFTIFGLGFLYSRKPWAAGISLGVAVLGGPSVWLGWLTILITGLIYLVTRPRRAEAPGGVGDRIENPTSDNSQPVGNGAEDPLATASHFTRNFLLAFAGSVFFAGTLLFMEPKGLSAVANSLAAFFMGQTGGGTPATLDLILAGWIFYNPLLVFLAVLASVRAIRERSTVDLILAVWWLAVMIVILVYPARQAGDLIWVNVPMWALAARMVCDVFFQRWPSKLELVQAMFTAVLMVSAWLNFLAILSPQAPDTTSRWLAVLFMFVFLGVSVILFTWGWSWQVALRGVSLGFMTLLVLFSFNSTWRASGLSDFPEQELFRTGPDFKGAAFLTKTVGNLSQWNTGNPTAIDLVAAGESPSVQWLFRKFPNASFADTLAKDASPSLVVTGEQASLNLGGTYSKLPFVKEETPSWSSMQLTDWLNWIAFRQAPISKVTLDLWVRSDIYPESPDFK